jgi:hypothetical protein
VLWTCIGERRASPARPIVPVTDTQQKLSNEILQFSKNTCASLR